MTSTVQFRVDTKTKQAVADIFASLGLDLSTGIKVYFQQVLLRKGIPFSLVTENGFTLAEEAKIIAEHKHINDAHKSGKIKPIKNWNTARKELLVD